MITDDIAAIMMVLAFFAGVIVGRVSCGGKNE